MILGHGENLSILIHCLFGAAGDAEALAATIRRGLDDATLRAAVGARGRQRVVERWTWRRCAEQTVDQYREVLAMPENQAKLRRNGRIS
ncbi:MAG: glycosyltransferase [Actinomycetota bacterium]